MDEHNTRHFAHHITLLMAWYTIEHVVTYVRLSHHRGTQSQKRKKPEILTKEMQLGHSTKMKRD
jgi:hypothetical protein